jgi:hypothetical protein
MQDSVVRQRRKGLKGSTNPRAKLTEDQVSAIRTSTETLAVLAVRYDVDQSLISLIKLRKAWKHVP